MKVVIGAYRGTDLVKRALKSLVKHATGITEIAAVDDSGDQKVTEGIRDLIYEASTQLKLSNKVRLNPEVVSLEREGYYSAMRAVCRVAQSSGGSPRFLFWEEDFVALGSIQLEAMESILMQRPNLAQLALLRGPHFKIEHKAGGLLPALIQRLGPERVDLQYDFVDLSNPDDPAQRYYRWPIITQKGTFTCNPSVWQAGISALGWPRGMGSEDRQRDRLLARGYRFAFLPEERVKHDGIRSGKGY